MPPTDPRSSTSPATGKPIAPRAAALVCVVAEAMQFSLPVVATRWRGVPSVVEEGVSGLLVPVRDATALADAIQRLAEEPELAGEMGQRGREIYLERFTEQRFRAVMERVLRELAPDAVRPAPTPRSGADSR